MLLTIHHLTGYRFSEPQARLVQLLRMTPESHVGQNVTDWRIDVDCNARLRAGRDGFGNQTTMLYIDGPIDRIVLAVTGEVLTEDRAGMVEGALEPLAVGAFLQSTRLTAVTPPILEFAQANRPARGDPFDRAHYLNEAIHDNIAFRTGRATGMRSAAEVLAEGAGAARDLAHLHIAAARALGIPARYVSGHIFLPSEQAEPRDVAHGWVEMFVDGYGWIGFDPTRGRCPDAAYVRVAIGLDYRDAAPVSGARTGGGVEELDVDVRVGLSQSQG